MTLRTWIVPRTGGPPAGAVVNLPGLPRLLIVAEGDKHLVAIDLRTGEARWRFAWGKSGRAPPQAARPAPLLHLAATARSPRSTCRPAPSSGACAIASASTAPTARPRRALRRRRRLERATRLYGVDPFSGDVRFERPASPTRAASCTNEPTSPPPSRARPSSRCTVVVVRDRHGAPARRLRSRDRRAAFDLETTVAPVGTSWLAFDELLLGNTPTGELVAIDAETGALRYRHVLGRALEADVPRRLEPVLRGRAPLFVPAHRRARLPPDRRRAARARSAPARPSPICCASTSAATSMSPRRAATWSLRRHVRVSRS